MNDLLVRLAEPGDVSEIYDISHDGTVRWSEKSYQNVLDPPYRVWVATIDNIIVAFLITRFVADEVEIINIVVKKNVRKSGLADLLIDEMLREALDNSASTVHLEVSLENPGATALYKKYGFVECGRRYSYYSDGSSAILMKKELI